MRMDAPFLVWKFHGMFLYFPSVFSCVALSQWQEQKAKSDLTNLGSPVLPMSIFIHIDKKRLDLAFNNVKPKDWSFVLD